MSYRKKNFNKEKNINSFIDKHKNEKCVIVGASHSMHKFNFENFDGKKIILGSALLRIRKRFKPDYLISSNNIFPVPEIKEHLDILNSYKNMTWLFTNSQLYSDIWTKSKSFLGKNLKINYSAFDDRHFNNKKCKPEKKCCSFLKSYPNNINAYDLLIKKTSLNKESYKFDIGVSIAEAGLALAILMGFKEIYITGVSLSLNKKYRTLENNKQKYYGQPSRYADAVLHRALKFTRFKFFVYYLKRLDFTPYIISAFEKINMYLTGTGLFAKNYHKAIINLKYLLKIAKIRSQIIHSNRLNTLTKVSIKNK